MLSATAIYPTSKDCSRMIGGSICVLKPLAVEEMLKQERRRIPITAPIPTTVKAMQTLHKKGRATSAPARVKARKLVPLNYEAVIAQALKSDKWLNSAMIKQLQERCDAETIEAKEICNKLLNEENTFIKDLEGFIECNEATNLRKKEILHKTWTEKVHEPIRRQIDIAMHSADYGALMKRRDQLYVEFLEHINKQRTTFLDASSTQYYGMGLCPERPSALTATTGRLQDPLLSQSRQRTAEQRVLLSCATGSWHSDRDVAAITAPLPTLVPLGRHGADWRQWVAMPLADIDSPVHAISRRRMTGLSTLSTLPLDMIAIAKEEMEKEKALAQRRISNRPPLCVKQDVAVQTVDFALPVC